MDLQTRWSWSSNSHELLGQLRETTDTYRAHLTSSSGPSSRDLLSEAHGFHDKVMKFTNLFRNTPDRSQELGSIEQVLWRSHRLSVLASTLTNHQSALACFADNLTAPDSDIHDVLDSLSPSLAQNCALAPLIQDTMEHARALCVEKYGVAPEMELWPDMDEATVDASETTNTSVSAIDDLLTFVPSHVHFILMELLKNSMESMIGRYTELEVDFAPPIRVSWGVDRARQFAVVALHDQGQGLSPLILPHLFDFMPDRRKAAANRANRPPEGHDTKSPATTASSNEPNYHYSRDFGTPFSGLGVGLPRARLLAEVTGGSLQLHSVPAVSCHAFLSLPIGRAS